MTETEIKSATTKKNRNGAVTIILPDTALKVLMHGTAEAINIVDSILVHCRETDNSKFGDHVLRMQTWDKNVVANGVYQTVTLPAGTYTASAYLRLMNMSGNPSMYIRVTSSDGTILAESEHLDKKYSDYISRLGSI